MASAFSAPLSGQDFQDAPARRARKERITNWQAARFGMFIHWGIRSVAAGKWEGRAIPRLGDCMAVNPELIHGTQASPFTRHSWVSGATMRELPDGHLKIYLHLFEWPADEEVVVEDLDRSVERTRLLGREGSNLEATGSGGRRVIRLPGQAIHPVASVVCLELREPSEKGPTGQRE